MKNGIFASMFGFAAILVPLMVLVLGIISYGYMLSFRQAISQVVEEVRIAHPAHEVSLDLEIDRRTSDANVLLDVPRRASTNPSFICSSCCSNVSFFRLSFVCASTAFFQLASSVVVYRWTSFNASFADKCCTPCE